MSTMMFCYYYYKHNSCRSLAGFVAFFLAVSVNAFKTLHVSSRPAIAIRQHQASSNTRLSNIIINPSNGLDSHKNKNNNNNDSGETEARPFTNSPQVLPRRQLLSQAAALSTLWPLNNPSTTVARAETPKKKTILITGSNSGIGFEASKRLAASGHTVILACRTLAKAQDAASRIRSSSVERSNHSHLIPIECDLANLQSIDQCVNQLKKQELSSTTTTTIDALCLNAGLARNTAAKDCLRTADGFELTVGTNHFGHFYLANQLLPTLPSTAQIIVTASSVHDPASPGGKQGVPATLGDLSGLRQQGKGCEMMDGGPFNADKAYKDSKLCNVLFTRELQRRLDQQGSKISVNAFSPGLIVGSGFFRDQNPVFTKLFDVAATDLFKVGETVEWGGGCLAYMTTVNTKGQFWNSDPGSSKYGDDAYGKQFRPMEVSVEGQDTEKGKQLWELSAKVLGLPA